MGAGNGATAGDEAVPVCAALRIADVIEAPLEVTFTTGVTEERDYGVKDDTHAEAGGR